MLNFQTSHSYGKSSLRRLHYISPDIIVHEGVIYCIPLFHVMGVPASVIKVKVQMVQSSSVFRFSSCLPVLVSTDCIWDHPQTVADSSRQFEVLLMTCQLVPTERILMEQRTPFVILVFCCNFQTVLRGRLTSSSSCKTLVTVTATPKTRLKTVRTWGHCMHSTSRAAGAGIQIRPECLTRNENIEERHDTGNPDCTHVGPGMKQSITSNDSFR